MTGKIKHKQQIHFAQVGVHLLLLPRPFETIINIVMKTPPSKLRGQQSVGTILGATEVIGEEFNTNIKFILLLLFVYG